MDLYRKLGQTGLLFEAVVKEVEQLVMSSQLRPGDSLPPERELAHRFGVSRTVVREAMKVLAERQLVTVLRGKGLIVARPSDASITASLGSLIRLRKAKPTQLTEVLMGLEPEMAARAAVRATPEQAEAIERIAGTYRNCVNDPRDVASLDMAFYQAISEAAQNEVAKLILDSVRELYRESVLPCCQASGSPRRAARYHNAVARAIVRQDAKSARRYMREHWDHVWRDLARLEEQLSGNGPTPAQGEAPGNGPYPRTG